MTKVIRIGRHSKNDIVINDMLVGRSVLAIIVDDNGDVYAQDLKSTNGVYINKKRIYGKVKLHSDDIVRIGNTTLPWQEYIKGIVNNMNYEFKQCANGHYYQGDECPYCKTQTAKEFKLCSKGHYYQGDECPYCKVKTVDKFKDRYYPLDDIIVDEDLRYLKTCPNGHAYGSRLNYCPYCGEAEVRERADLITGLPGSLKLVFDRETFIKINNGIENKVSELEIRYLYSNGYKTDYRIVGLPDFNYNSIIKIGRQLFTGEEFIKWVDLMINIKEFENQ